jgi:HEAT repeat protein
MGPEAKTAVPALTELLKDDDEWVRRAAAWALGKIGPEAKTATPALTELLRDKWVRQTAASTLGNIGPEAKTAIPALTELLQDTDKDLGKTAAEALQKIKEEK